MPVGEHRDDRAEHKAEHRPRRFDRVVKVGRVAARARADAKRIKQEQRRRYEQDEPDVLKHLAAVADLLEQRIERQHQQPADQE